MIYLMLISGISPLPLILPTVEHFPYGILLILFSKCKKDQYIFLIFISIYFFASFFIIKESHFLYIVQAVNFISPIFFFKKYHLDINKIARIVFFVYFFIGLLQTLSLLSWAEPFMRLILPRFNGDAWGSYRGISMLETEPARASFQLLMLFIVGRPYKKLFSQIDYLMICILFLSQILLIKSTTGLLLSSVLVLIIFLSKIELKPRNIIIFLCIITSLLTLAPLNPKIATLLRLVTESGLQGAFDALAATSGGRFLGLVNSIEDIIKWPFGYGADYTYFSKNLAGLDDSIAVEGYKTHVGNRAVSAPTVFTRTFGVLFLLYLIVILRKLMPNGINRYSVGVFIIITAYSPPGSEIALLSVLMTSFWIKKRNKRE